MKVAVVIPARYASTRLPGKPLLEAGGKTVIQHVYENASRARGVDEVVVATDDERIAGAVEKFGGRAVMTSAQCASGTDRVAEVVRRGMVKGEVIVNVQGDEPELRPEQVEALVEVMRDEGVGMGTLAVEMEDAEAMADPGQVKVVTDTKGDALYFSRSAIPCYRDTKGRAGRFLRHVGIYAYRKEFLLKVAGLKPTTLEQAEKLEQLRVLENGLRIRVGRTDFCPTGIDTPEDLERFRRRIEEGIKRGGLGK